MVFAIDTCKLFCYLAARGRYSDVSYSQSDVSRPAIADRTRRMANEGVSTLAQVNEC